MPSFIERIARVGHKWRMIDPLNRRTFLQRTGMAGLIVALPAIAAAASAAVTSAAAIAPGAVLIQRSNHASPPARVAHYTFIRDVSRIYSGRSAFRASMAHL